MSDSVFLGVGFDPGTMNCVSARRDDTGNPKISRLRDAYFDLPKTPVLMRSVKAARINHFFKVLPDGEERVVILGDDAMQWAATHNDEAKRPLAQGLISSSEIDAMAILAKIIQILLGKPKEEDEVCAYSVPADPIDADRDVVYHTRALGRIIERLGYEAVPVNEAMAVVFAEAADTKYSAIGISFGSGMTNVALVSRASLVHAFSLSRGGDYVDDGAAKASGAPRSRVCSVKEGGLNILDPDEGMEHERDRRIAEALAAYYCELVDYVVANLIEQFRDYQGDFNTEIPIIVSGGTSLAGGFLDYLKKKLNKRKLKRLPFKISEIRLAKQQLNAVALGALAQAELEHQDD